MFASTKPAYRRFWLIDRELQAGRYPTLESLAELTEADPRTIQRDLDEMRISTTRPSSSIANVGVTNTPKPPTDSPRC